MGYAATLLYGDNFQIGGVMSSIKITDVSSNIALGSITLPSDMLIKKAYLDLNIRLISSDSGGAFNWLNAALSIQAEKTGTGVYYTAYSCPAQSFYCLGAGVYPGTYIFGTADVKDGFAAGTQTDIRLANADALGNGIWLWDVQPVARIIMR